MTPDEIKEVFLQSAIYCSVPAANVAFKSAKRCSPNTRQTSLWCWRPVRDSLLTGEPRTGLIPLNPATALHRSSPLRRHCSCAL
ncbi:hypothetical protein [Glutamicibacter sp. NPDC087344]|uniref:hypothetical protein n=1 Tax=Glutamicibacter sp. NPDC087344 TaxID=3363994 RepID=UPI0037F984EA